MTAAAVDLIENLSQERLAAISRRPSKREAEQAVRTLIAYAGDDPDREGVAGTQGYLRWLDGAFRASAERGDDMNEVLRLARERAADHLWLGVWEHNPRAIAFYRKYGFREVGEHVFQLGRDPQRDLILVRSVSGGPDVAA